jgi:hypothetical protein
MVRAKWAALRRVSYTPAAPDCRLTIDLYEQPGILRGTTTLPFSDARINQFSAGSIGIAPDGRAVLVQAEGTVHLLRW